MSLFRNPNYGKCIFAAPGQNLKISSLLKITFEVAIGHCELREIRTGSYFWIVSDSKRKKNFKFKTDRETNIVLYDHDNGQFTIFVKFNGETTQLIGKLDEKEDCTLLSYIMDNINKEINTYDERISVLIENIPEEKVKENEETRQLLGESDETEDCNVLINALDDIIEEIIALEKCLIVSKDCNSEKNGEKTLGELDEAEDFTVLRNTIGDLNKETNTNVKQLSPSKLNSEDNKVKENEETKQLLGESDETKDCDVLINMMDDKEKEINANIKQLSTSNRNISEKGKVKENGETRQLLGESDETEDCNVLINVLDDIIKEIIAVEKCVSKDCNAEKNGETTLSELGETEDCTVLINTVSDIEKKAKEITSYVHNLNSRLCIFSAPGENFKISTMNKFPVEIGAGYCELREINTGSYFWLISDSKRRKHFKFKTGKETNIASHNRDGQFIIVVTYNGETTNLVGKLDRTDECTLLINIMNNINKEVETDDERLNALKEAILKISRAKEISTAKQLVCDLEKHCLNTVVQSFES